MLHSLKSKLLLWGQTLIERGAWFFAPISWIWGAISFVKNWLYDRELLPTVRANAVVVSVGNLVAGGTGKTPLVLLLASQFPHRKIAILSRGYGPVADEPALLAGRLPRAKVYVGKNRSALALQAVEEGAELIFLDDGFQHRKLRRDFDLVILDGADPYGKGHFIPWGFLRDSPKRLKQAAALFVRGPGFPEAIEVELSVRRILDLEGNEVSSLAGWKVGLFCGIAKPQSFRNTLASLGAEVVDEWILADHEPAGLKQLSAFASRCKSLGARALVCTEKDFIKLSQEISSLLPILFLEMELKVVRNREKWEMLIEKIDQKIDNSSRYERRSKN